MLRDVFFDGKVVDVNRALTDMWQESLANEEEGDTENAAIGEDEPVHDELVDMPNTGFGGADQQADKQVQHPEVTECDEGNVIICQHEVGKFSLHRKK